MAEMKAGQYKVIGDELTLKEGTKTEPKYVPYKRGAVVKLTAEQAAKFGAGTRPLVVPAPRGREEAADTETPETPETPKKASGAVSKVGS